MGDFFLDPQFLSLKLGEPKLVWEGPLIFFIDRLF
jgi:hypothetical protein